MQVPTLDDILARDDARYRAMIDVDLAALDAVLADALVYVHSTGAVETKPQFVASLASGRVRYRRMDRDVAHFHAWPGCAIVQGTVEVAAEVDGRPYRTRARFGCTWVREHDAWVLAAWTATAVPA